MNPHPVHHGSAVLHHFTAGHKQQLENRSWRAQRGRRAQRRLWHHKDTENTEFRNRTKIFGHGFSDFLIPLCLCGKKIPLCVLLWKGAKGEEEDSEKNCGTTKTQRTPSFGIGLNLRTRIFSDFLIPPCLCAFVVKKSPLRPPSPSASSPD